MSEDLYAFACLAYAISAVSEFCSGVQDLEKVLLTLVAAKAAQHVAVYNVGDVRDKVALCRTSKNEPQDEEEGIPKPCSVIPCTQSRRRLGGCLSKEVQVLVGRHPPVSGKEFANARQPRLATASRRRNHRDLKKTPVVSPRRVGVVVWQEGKPNRPRKITAACCPKIMLGAKSGDLAQFVELEVLQSPLFPVPRQRRTQDLPHASAKVDPHGIRTLFAPAWTTGGARRACSCRCPV